MRSAKFSALLGLVIQSLVLSVYAQTEPALALRRVASGLSLPDFVAAPPGDTDRLFILEQHRGAIRILNLGNGAVQTNAFLTLSGVTTGNEQGLLGLAFHPNYASNGFFYVNYTTTGGGPAGHSEIARFQAIGDPRRADIADPATKTVLLAYDQPEENHNAGWLGFGPDGFLYISVGDGGGANDQHGTIGNGQNRNTLLGKMLRIDVDHGSPYAIPNDNPFRGVSGAREEIWALGLRNPWRCSIDRVTGDLWIGDVGQDRREEIDVIPAGVGGLNFGWRPREGSSQNPAHPSETPVTPATSPVYDYGHGPLGLCVIGGCVYRGSAIPGLQGVYLFADYGSSRFWSFRYTGAAVTNVLERTAELNSGSPKPITQLSSFGEDANGELYLCDLTGSIYAIVSATPTSIRLVDPGVSNGIFSFRFGAAAHQSYVVERRDSLDTGAWQTLTNVSAATTETNTLVTDNLAGTARYYRIRVP
jgi:glucose/arabinose dehydrogenase